MQVVFFWWISTRTPERTVLVLVRRVSPYDLHTHLEVTRQRSVTEGPLKQEQILSKQKTDYRAAFTGPR